MNKAVFIAEFVAQLRWEDFPPEVIVMVKRALLDTLAVGLAGSRTRSAEITRRLTTTFPMGPREAIVWGTADRTSCLWAALANAVAASSLDADDGHSGAVGHLGGVVVPAALAAAERADASGKTVLEAIVAGYEVGIRAGMNLHRHPDGDLRTLHGSGTFGALGAAAAAGKVFGFSKELWLNALGITESITPMAQGAGLELGRVSHVKESMGWGAFTGMTAALLAEGGMSGVFSMADTADPEGILTRRLGIDYEILKIYFKAYPACRWSHHAIERVLAARQERGIKPEDIVQIRVGTQKTASLLSIRRPQSIEEAEYSIPFLIATALIHGRIGPEEMNEPRLADSAVLALADKVTVEHDVHADAWFPKVRAHVEIITRDGRKVELPAEGSARGYPENPFTPEELEKKFDIYAGVCLKDETRTRLRQAIMELESLSSASDLTRLLRVRPKS